MLPKLLNVGDEMPKDIGPIPMARTSLTGSIVFTPNEAIDSALTKHINEQLALLLVLPKKHKPRPKLAYAEWAATKEGRFHSLLMTKYVFNAVHIDARSAMSIQRKLQSQGVDLRGRPPQFDPRKHNWTSKRQVRLYIMNKLLAKGLGIDTTNWPSPLTPMQQADAEAIEPRDTVHSLERFEKWSGLLLPRAAWLQYTLTERQALSTRHRGLAREHDGGIALGEYLAMRRRGEA